MSKVSLSILAVLLLLFVSACSDEAESDNDSGLTDNETVSDTEQKDDTVSDDSVTDEIADETVDNELNDDLSDEVSDTEPDETADETVDETTDETPDETADEVQPDDDAVSGPSEAAILCCEEIIKEWFRCEGTYDSTKIKGCTDCLDALNTCSEFNPSLDTFACTAECNAICEGTGTADNSGKDRRKVADGYCKFVVDQNCGISPEDVSSFGAIDGLDACYDL